MKMNNKEILTKAIDSFGVTNQLDMVIEECAELIQAINKAKRKGLLKYIGLIKRTEILNQEFITIDKSICYNSLCAEVADVEIMIEQMRLLLDEETIDLIKERKLQRLEDRLIKS